VRFILKLATLNAASASSSDGTCPQLLWPVSWNDTSEGDALRRAEREGLSHAKK
jgi:hypothetical protein